MYKKKVTKKTVGIIGLGYVGLPLALKFSKSKLYKIIGIDTNKQKINFLKKNKSYISNIKNEEIKILNKNNNILTHQFSYIKNCDIIIFSLPTPLSSNKDPDMSYIENAVNLSENYFRKNQVIILESTVYPGATEEFFLPIIKKKKFVLGKNFYLGFSPEREDPGNKKYNISNIIKLTSGHTSECLKKIDKLYNSINIKTKTVSTIRTAEMTKLYENIFRSVNIGMVNEMKLICDKMKLDIYEIIEAAKTKPFGFNAFYPGPGLGGHCIPIDPYLLTWKAKQYDLNTKFIELSADINNSMPNFVLDKINKGLNLIGKNFSNSKILIIGVAYKKNINDIRESPALKIIQKLIQNHSNIIYHDKFIPNFEIKIKNNKNLKFRSTKLSLKNLKSIDLVCVVTDHDYIDYNLLKNNVKIIVDCRDKYRKSKFILKA